jgi:hypothetical protein
MARAEFSPVRFEIDRFRRETGLEIKPLTLREILDEEISKRDG